jgi:hypothetical protein
MVWRRNLASAGKQTSALSRSRIVVMDIVCGLPLSVMLTLSSRYLLTRAGLFKRILKYLKYSLCFQRKTLQKKPLCVWTKDKYYGRS